MTKKIGVTFREFNSFVMDAYLHVMQNVCNHASRGDFTVLVPEEYAYCLMNDMTPFTIFGHTHEYPTQVCGFPLVKVRADVLELNVVEIRVIKQGKLIYTTTAEVDYNGGATRRPRKARHKDVPKQV